MANLEKSHPLNVPGPLFTDTTCIDCGTCYHLGPSLFHEEEKEEKSVVIRQPETLSDWQEAKRAMQSCPTNSIGVRNPPELFKLTGDVLPLKITDSVYYLGFTSRDSYGATSYLIKRESGNVLVDSPKFHPQLVKAMEEMGGVKWMFLSHQDDVADHQQYHDHFKCERIIHQDDLSSDTKSCEKILAGREDFFLGTDLKIIMTPGHTKGHMNLLFNHEFLFTGDHLFVNDHKITASRGVCWYSWEEQVKSIQKLLPENFRWIMPGHGGWENFGDQARDALKDLLNRIRS